MPICPVDYDLHTYAILRELYGRLDRKILKEGSEVTSEDIKARLKWALGQ